MARRFAALIALLILVVGFIVVTAAIAPEVPLVVDEPDPIASPASTPFPFVELPQPTAGAAPIRVEIPALGAVGIVPVGLAQDGQAEIPQDISTVGWYRFGSTPDLGRGSTVLVGHRDSKGGRGALFDLEAVPVGANLAVTDEAGGTTAFLVVSNASIDKRAVPFDDLYARTGPPRLVIISCGGEYVRGSGYQDNQVLVANIAGTP